MNDEIIHSGVQDTSWQTSTILEKPRNQLNAVVRRLHWTVRLALSIAYDQIFNYTVILHLRVSLRMQWVPFLPGHCAWTGPVVTSDSSFYSGKLLWTCGTDSSPKPRAACTCLGLAAQSSCILKVFRAQDNLDWITLAIYIDTVFMSFDVPFPSLCPKFSFEVTGPMTPWLLGRQASRCIIRMLTGASGGKCSEQMKAD